MTIKNSDKHFWNHGNKLISHNDGSLLNQPKYTK